jgi:hemerythrin superfamily protein
MPDQKPIEMLKSDHRRVEGLFNDFDQTDTEDYESKQSIAEDVCEDLKVHAQVEEEVFYPEVEGVSDEGKEMIKDSRREHQEIKDLITQLESMNPEDDEYEEKFKSLEDVTKHHVQEEESKVFPFAEENLADKMGMGMTAKMMAMKGKEMGEEKLGI